MPKGKSKNTAKTLNVAQVSINCLSNLYPNVRRMNYKKLMQRSLLN